MDNPETPVSLRILHLAEVPEAIPVLTEWFLTEWGPYYGPNGPGNAEADLRTCLNRDRMPLAHVALDGDGAVLGTAALKPCSMASHVHLGPWLAALLVLPAARRCGVGAALVATIEDAARALGCEMIYCGTDGAIAGLLQSRGWEALEGGVPTLRDPAMIYRRMLR